jgi:hypothetical protein
MILSGNQEGRRKTVCRAPNALPMVEQTKGKHDDLNLGEFG